MTFNYFRIIIVLLASFAAFFAYICRLNLRVANLSFSLIISDMVETGDIIPSQEISGRNSGIRNLSSESSLHTLSSFITTEEHAIAWIYQSKVGTKKRTSKVGNTKRIVEARKARRLEATSQQVIPLSIELDVRNQVKTNKKSSSSFTTDAGDNKNSREVVEEPTEEVAIVPEVGPYLLKWSEEDRNNLLGAFFVGYVFFQIPSARAAEIFGSKSLFLMTGFGASVCSLIFPLACKCSDSIIYAYIIRVIMGATQGALFPAVYVLLCEWLPKNERNKWLPYPSAFSRFGAIVMNLIVPLILKKYGWEAVFYICGSATFICSILFLLFGSNSPEQSYWVSKQELVFIESHMEAKKSDLTEQQRNNIMTASGFTINERIDKKPSISLLKMAKNKAVLILSLVMFSSEWSNLLLLIKLPDFLKAALNMDLMEIGYLNSILITLYCIQYPLSGYCATKMEQLNVEALDSLNVRKIFEAIAQGLQAVGCLIIAFSSNKVVVISALILMMIGRATVGGGQCLMPPELSKEYPGTVFAFANTIANLAGIIGPTTINFLVKNPYDYSDWFLLYILSASLFLISGVVFCIFAENEPQNYCKQRKLKDKSISQAQLTFGKSDIEQVFKMDAFSRVSTEPKPNLKDKSVGLELGKHESRLI